MKKLTPKSCGHKTVPLNHFQSYRIILESVDTILYPHTNLYTTLIIYIYIQQHINPYQPTYTRENCTQPGTYQSAAGRQFHWGAAS